MKVYRVALTRHASSPEEMLSGEGAREFGGRWNSPGIGAVYCAESLSLAALEILVHVPQAQTLSRYRFLDVDVPTDLIVSVDDDVTTLDNTATFGDAMLGANGVLAFGVFSVVMPYERNIVLNPAHPDFSTAIAHGEVRAFPFDERLLLR